MKTTTITISILAAVTLIVSVLLLFQQTAQPVGATGFMSTNIGYVATTSTATAVSTSVRILATTTGPVASFSRVYASICNTGATSIGLRLDGDKPVNLSTSGGILVAAGACYEITDRNQYHGSVTASSTSGTNVVEAVEYVQ